MRETARDLLSRPPFGEDAPGPVTDVLARLRGLLARFVEALLGSVTGNTLVAWTVVIGMALVGVVLVLRWSRRVTAATTSAGSVPGERPRPAQDWWREAERHADALRWPEAVRAAYGGLVADLVGTGVVADAAGRTVGEIDREVAAAAPSMATGVRAAGVVFEDVWYGHRDAGADDIDTIRDAGADLRRRP